MTPTSDRARPVALVTGASSGIGRAVALTLHERGLEVYGTRRREPGAEEAFRVVHMDVTDDASVERGVARVVRDAGRVDVAVACAGVALAGAIEDTSMSEAHAQLETNFFGVLRVCKAVLPSMRARGAGLIIVVGSLGGLMGLPFQGLYSASKFALEGLVESLRLEVRPFGIRVTIVDPGDVQTQLTDNRVKARATGGASPYRESFDRALSIIERDERQGVASDVAGLIARLVGVRRPRVRYTVGHWGQRIAVPLKPLLPSRRFEALLGATYGV